MSRAAALKQGVKRQIPVALMPAALGAKRRYDELRARGARRAFDGAQREPAWLDPALLPALQKRYGELPAYGYDPGSLDLRGAGRARLLRPLLAPGARTLELACADGMVSAHLARAGMRASALDLSDELFDARAAAAGVRLERGDAARVPAEDGEFDLVFSYNAFEHLPDPKAVLREAIRVVRPGGVVYLHFGPLYRSAFGLHAALSVTVPFCQLLFERPALERFTSERGLKPIPFETLNEWPLARFRDLWRCYRTALEPEVYRELPDTHGLELVAAFPSCFRSTTDDFEELITATIEARFRRIE